MIASKIITKLAIVLTIAATFIGVLWYLNHVRADLAQERVNNNSLKNSITEQQQLIERMEQDFERIRNANRSLITELDRQRAEVRNLSDRLNVTASGRSRDFGLLASQRPTAIERLVNRGTQNAVRCLELASGAKHTEEELAATLSSQINPECPTLANPNYRGP